MRLFWLSILVTLAFGAHAEEKIKPANRSPNQVEQMQIEGQTQLKPGMSFVYCAKGIDFEKTVMSLNTALVAEGIAWKWPNAQGDMVDLGIMKPFTVSAPFSMQLKDVFEVCVTLTKR